jgi:hypothetical protein
LLTAVGAAFSLYCFILCQAAVDPAAWQHHGIYQRLGIAASTGNLSRHRRPKSERPSKPENLGHPNKSRGMLTGHFHLF